MLRTSVAAVAVLLIATVAAANPAGDSLVINEIYPNPPGTYDGAEFIEIYNPTGSDVNIGNWVLAGTEYDTICGEDRWQFPDPTWVGAGDYLIVAKDVADGDGFWDVFGFYPDFEMPDTTAYFDVDYPDGVVPDLILLDDDPATYYSDELVLVGGSGYGKGCTNYNQKDVVYLCTTASLAKKVDIVEYVDPDVCDTDPCTGDDLSDHNAYQGIPYLGNTIGRDLSSTDTNSSIDDFTLQAPTPGAQNVLNAPPWVRYVRYSPIPPTTTSTTEISAIMTDADGTIDSAKVYYNIGGLGWSTVTMVADPAPADSIYRGQVPIAPITGTQVDYFVRAIDDVGAKMDYPAESFGDPYTYSVGYTTIEAIQEVPYGGDASPRVGRSENIHGIVTAGMDNYYYNFFHMHEGTGKWKGIKVYTSYMDLDINEGDSVTVCGTISEYYNETEITPHFEEAVVVHKTGKDVYGYTDVAKTTWIASIEPGAEAWESQLIRVTDAALVDTLPYGQFAVTDSFDIGGDPVVADTCRIDDWAYYAYYAEVGDEFSEIRGILMYSYSLWKLEPRYDDDILGPPRIADVRYLPIPPTAPDTLTITADMTDDVGIVSATLYWRQNAEGPPWTETPMTTATRGIYEAKIGPFSDDTRIYYYTECSDGAKRMTKRKPIAGSYSLYVGLKDIYDVQYVTSPGTSDASTLDGLAVNVQGYVTAEPGVYSDYILMVQDADGAWNGIKVYDWSGSLSFARGDEVVICGKVDENFGETEVELHFPEAAQLVGARGSGVSPTVLSNTNVLQAKSTGEQYEGVLVQVIEGDVVDADIGYGEWAISNQTPADTCRVDDYGDYTYDPVQNDVVIVTGPVMFSYGNYKIEPRDDDDIVVNPVGVDDGTAAARFGMSQNAPNPFNPKTRIAFSLAEASDVLLEVYNVAGRKVTTLVDRRLGAGPHYAEWDGRADGGARVASGVYFYKLIAGDKDVSKKMVLLK